MANSENHRPYHAAIRAIEYHLPEAVLDNAAVGCLDSGWTAAAVEAKTGIVERRIAGASSDAGSLALAAARKLLDAGVCARQDVDFLLYCTHSMAQPCSVTACRLQHELGLSTRCGALELTLGCSGFVYALGVLKGLIETGQIANALLITADTYSRLLAEQDVGLRSIFGDGAAATLVQRSAKPSLGNFVYGSDGSGARHLEYAPVDATDGDGTVAGPRLRMDGPEVFNFTLRAVPEALARLNAAGSEELGPTDLYVFHQANAYMLEHLRKRLRIPPEKFLVSMKYTGNTVSSSIPIALKHAMQERRLQAGDRVVLAGFGIGFSWAACQLVWRCP